MHSDVQTICLVCHFTKCQCDPSSRGRDFTNHGGWLHTPPSSKYGWLLALKKEVDECLRLQI